MRLIDSEGSFTINATDNTGYSLAFGGGIISCADEFGHIEAEFFADDAPAVDAVAVVRCKDCKHARKSEDAFDWDGVTPLCECNYSRQPNRWHEYCSYGERKGGETDA